MMNFTQPSSAFQSTIVNGERSLSEFAIRIANCPAFAYFAISGALIVTSWKFGTIVRVSRISNPPPFAVFLETVFAGEGLSPKSSKSGA